MCITINAVCGLALYAEPTMHLVPLRSVCTRNPPSKRAVRCPMSKPAQSPAIPSRNGVADAPGLPLRIICILVGAIFAVELVIMAVLHAVPWSAAIKALLDATLLPLVLVPVFYLVLFRPLVRLIDDGRQSRAELHDRIELIDKIVDTAFDAIIVIDARGMIQAFNPAAERMFGWSAGEVLGQNVKMLMAEPHRQQHDHYIDAYLATGNPKIIGSVRETTGQRHNGDVFPMELAVMAMQVDGQPAFVGTVRDITQRKKDELALRRTNEALEQKVRERTAELATAIHNLSAELRERKNAEANLLAMATSDALTGILNRRQFDQVLNTELERARRYQSTFSLIMFDIDYFKRINDRFGHLTGDAVLKALAEVVSSKLRATDVFGRWGGEEFILLVHGKEGGAALAEKLRGLIEHHAFPHGEQLTCSFGLTACLTSDNFGSIMKRVDWALYRAKERGRDRIEVA